MRHVDGDHGEGLSSKPTSTTATRTVVLMTNVERMSLFRIFVCQANFDHRLIRESWYGHHFPLSRLLCWAFLFAILTAGTGTGGLVFLYLWGGITTTKTTITSSSSSEATTEATTLLEEEQFVDWKTLSEANVDCLLEVCSILSTTLPSCRVQNDGLTAITDWENYDGVRNIPFPTSCDLSMNVLFQLVHVPALPVRVTTDHLDDALDLIITEPPERSESASSSSSSSSLEEETTLWYLVTTFPFVKEEEEEKSMNSTTTSNSLFTMTRQCELYTFLVPMMAMPLLSAEDMVNHTGRVIRPKLIEAICQDLVPVLVASQNGLLNNFSFCIFLAMFIVVPLLFILHVINTLGIGLWLLPLTLVVRCLLPWPQNFVGHEKIKFGSVWQHLWVLSMVALYCEYVEPHHHVLEFCVPGLFYLAMIGTSLFWLSDHGAARGWLDLAFLTQGLPILLRLALPPWLLPMARDLIHRFDVLDLVGWATTIVRWLVPGIRDWDKLTVLWVIWRCYPYRKKLERRFMGRWFWWQSDRPYHSDNFDDENETLDHLKLS